MTQPDTPVQTPLASSPFTVTLPDEAPERDRYLWAGLLLIMTLAAYVPALRAGFIWDDDHYVTQNRALRDVDGLKRIWTEVTTEPQYYPLTHTIYWLEYQFWELEPLGYHAVNVVVHAGAAILLW